MGHAARNLQTLPATERDSPQPFSPRISLPIEQAAGSGQSESCRDDFRVGRPYVQANARLPALPQMRTPIQRARRKLDCATVYNGRDFPLLDKLNVAIPFDATPHL